MKNIIIQIIILVFTSQLIGQTVYSGLNIPYDPCNPCSGDNITYGATTYFNQPNQVASDSICQKEKQVRYTLRLAWRR